uniref:Uncharacterized protein n=1 Tax=Acrobeloides nanus TaxID=290746 RepID=A0A914CYF5_9BILA
MINKFSATSINNVQPFEIKKEEMESSNPTSLLNRILQGIKAYLSAQKALY